MGKYTDDCLRLNGTRRAQNQHNSFAKGGKAEAGFARYPSVVATAATKLIFIFIESLAPLGIDFSLLQKRIPKPLICLGKG